MVAAGGTPLCLPHRVASASSVAALEVKSAASSSAGLEEEAGQVVRVHVHARAHVRARPQHLLCLPVAACLHTRVLRQTPGQCFQSVRG